MIHTPENRVQRVFKVAFALLPWLAAMYLYYWLDSSGTWSIDTPHRGKLSVLILASGMGLSFLIYSRLTERNAR